MKRFNYKYKRKSKFLAVREFQKRGAIHYHVLIDWQVPAKLKKKSLRSLERKLETKIWGHRFVNLRSLREQKEEEKPVDNVGVYLVKYMTKDLYEKKLLHNKIYLCSRGLSRSQILVQNFAREKIKDLNLSKSQIVFFNENKKPMRKKTGKKLFVVVIFFLFWYHYIIEVSRNERN